jgi:succinate dehydrogenase/fumarate reductase flavoprotein subunit
MRSPDTESLFLKGLTAVGEASGHVVVGANTAKLSDVLVGGVWLTWNK